MDSESLNIELFKKLAFALVIIRNTPKGIRSDVFTRSLAKRLYDRPSMIIDEYLVRRQDDLLSRLLKDSNGKLATSISMMDLTTLPNEKFRFNDQYGQFADKVYKLKERKRFIKIDDIEILLDTISKWLVTNELILPIDACLYTIQLIANQLKTDNDKPYHIILDLLPIIDKFLDCLFDILEQINRKNISFIHEMIISLSSSNSCISRILDKIFSRILHLCEHSNGDQDDSIDRFFNILHDIVHNRSIYQSRLSQRSVEKIYRFLNQISSLLDGKANFTHTLKLQGQLQAGNYKLIETTIQTYPSYTSSSSSSEHSQMQQQRSFSNNRLSSKLTNLDYSMSQSSQYF